MLRHLEEEIRAETTVKVSVRDHPPTSGRGEKLTDPGIAGFGERFTEGFIGGVVCIALPRRNQSETALRIASPAGIEMDADDAGGVGSIRDFSPFDEVEIPVILTGQEHPDPRSFSRSLPQDFIVENFAEFQC